MRYFDLPYLRHLTNGHVDHLGAYWPTSRRRTAPGSDQAPVAGTPSFGRSK
jgi:hypothetical protein